MHVLFTVGFYYPQVGGSEIAVQQIAERLCSRGHRVEVATSLHPGRDFEYLNGVRVHQFNVKGNEVAGIQGEGDRYVEWVRAWRGDIIVNYAAQIWSTDLLLPHLERLGPRKVFLPVGFSRLHAPAYAGYFSALRACLSRFDAVVCHSSTYQDAVYCHSAVPVTVIPNGADESEFEHGDKTAFRSMYDIGGRLLVLCVSNHTPEKGHERVIRAFLDACLRDSVLVIVGEPMGRRGKLSECYRSCLLRQLTSRRRIRLLSGISRADVVEAFKSADLFLFGSDVECAPLVLVEAMASGTAWISTDVGNSRGLKGGVVVDGEEDLAVAVSELGRNRAQRERLAFEGVTEWRKNLTWGRIAEQYEQLFRACVLERNESSPGSQ